ncbi:MAG: hypothetical protein K6D03_00895 [Solobacterium sp.]|nr:hypothetical protein [Solobacterium sp.]
MKGTYRIAERTIEITSVYDRVQQYCRDYRYEGVPDFRISITQEDIDCERKRSEKEQTNVPVINYSDPYLEELAVYRRIAEKMPYYDTFLFHGSAVSVDGEAYIFTAVSGTGKSTHARLWRELLKEKAVMVNDDKPLIRITESRALVYGTPYNGKHHLGNNICVPVKAVCILERSEKNHIRQITFEEAYLKLLKQAYRPADPRAMEKTLDLIDRLSERVKFYRLGCNMDKEAAETAYNAMKG